VSGIIKRLFARPKLQTTGWRPLEVIKINWPVKFNYDQIKIFPVDLKSVQGGLHISLSNNRQTDKMPSILTTLSLLAFASFLHPSIADQKVLKKGQQKCPDVHYSVHMVSQDPLVIYLENFIQPEEAKHLQDVSYVLPFRCSDRCLQLPTEETNSQNPRSPTNRELREMLPHEHPSPRR
jgi:hypothetical protein